MPYMGMVPPLFRVEGAEGGSVGSRVMGAPGPVALVSIPGARGPSLLPSFPFLFSFGPIKEYVIMVVDAVRTYLDAANGLTELSRKQAVAAAKSLLKANGSVSPQVAEADGPPPRLGQNIQALAGELIETSQANRAAIADLVRAEVESALERMDMVPRSEYERVVRRVAELERRMAARQPVERVVASRGESSPVPRAPVEGEEGRQEPVPAPEASVTVDAPETAASTVGSEPVEETVPSSSEPVVEGSSAGEERSEGSDEGPEEAVESEASDASKGAAATRAKSRTGGAKGARTKTAPKRGAKGKSGKK